MNAPSADPARSTLFELREHDDVLVLELTGEFGSLGWRPQEEDLQLAVLTAFDHMPRPRIVLDLSGVTYAGSEFIGFLLSLWKRLKARRGRLVLAGIQENVSQVLNTLNLDRILPQYQSVEAALEAVNNC